MAEEQNIETPATLDNKQKAAQGVAAFLLSRPYKIKITGPIKSVEPFVAALKDLRELLPLLTTEEDEDRSPLATIVVGCVGYILGMQTYLKITGQRKDINKLLELLEVLRKHLDRVGSQPS